MPGCSLGGAGSLFVGCVRALGFFAAAEPRGVEVRGRDDVRLDEAMGSRYPRPPTRPGPTRSRGREREREARRQAPLGQAPQTPTRLPLAATENTPRSGVTAWM